MRNERRTLSLREAGIALYDCDHRTPAQVPNGVPWIAIPQMKDGRLDISDARRMSEADWKSWTQRVCPKQGDVILSRRCNPGETAVVPRDLRCALGQNLVILRSESSLVRQDFLRWLVRGPDWWQEVQGHINVGAVFDSLTCRDIPNFRLPIPAIEEQESIAGTLDSLDDRIDLNRRMNRTLEEMARALFKSWFVDFDPVCAKAAGKKPWGMDAKTAALFPDAFEDSEIGEVPKGWRVHHLGDPAICSVVSPGIDAPRSEKRSYIATGDVDRGEVTSDTEGEVGSLPSRANMQPGNGRVWFARMKASPKFLWTMEEDRAHWDQRILSTGFAGLEASTRWYQSLLYCFVSSPEFDALKDSLANGTTMQAVNNDGIRLIPLVVPPEPVARTFDEYVRLLFRRVWHNSFEGKTLASLRDALLPKLLSGEIRLKPSK